MKCFSIGKFVVEYNEATHTLNSNTLNGDTGVATLVDNNKAEVFNYNNGLVSFPTGLATPYGSFLKLIFE